MAVTGLLFNIQKFSLHDGPGIRTVVFFKGCPLSCRWCSNPESQREKPCLLWDSAVCVRCMRCVDSCPVHALEKGCMPGPLIDRERCTGCGACVAVCPQKALSPDSRSYTIDEVVTICLQDRPFYEESGGGVTLSGGEALTQRQFAVELLQALKKEKIHTVLETTGFAPPGVFKKAVELTDMLIFDLKHYDEKRHIEGTGFHNAPILINLKNVLETGHPVLPRIPVIPGYNNSPDDARGFASLFSALGLKQVQLLPFHQFGERKYDLLRIPYTMRGIPQLHEKDVEEFRQIISGTGINCFF